MATINAGYARCYSSGSTSYGYYKVDVEYTAATRNGTTITVTGVTIKATRQGTGYTTNPIRCSASCGNQSFSNAQVNSSGSASPASFSKSLGTCTISNVAAGTSSVGCWVYFHAYNANGDLATPLNTTVNIPVPTAGSPSYTSGPTASAGRTSITVSYSASAGSNASLTTQGCDISTDGSTIAKYIGNNPATFDGLTPNTLYYYRGWIQNSAGLGLNSSWKSIYTTGNAPSATGLPIANITRTSATVSINGTYDTNASWGGWECVFGTTTNYGTSTTGTMSGLSANTKYYVRGRFYDNWGRWSNYVYNEFTTLGNAPTITQVTPSASRTTCSLTSNSVSYDTNASFKSVSVKYGTTTNYGTTVATTELSNLSPNTTYYYSMTVTDNWNRTSAAVTGSFKTTANAPTFTTQSIEAIDINFANVKFIASADTNVTISKYTLYKSNNTKVDENTTGAFTITNLDSETVYSYYCVVTDSAGRTATSSTLTFETLAATFVHYMDNNGVDKLVKLVALGDLKNFINHMELEVGGLAYASGRSYTLACTNSTSTTSMRSNLISIKDTTLSKSDACFMQSTLYSWKIQHYDGSGNGLTEITGNIGEACVINFLDKNGYIAIEIASTDEEKIKSSTKICGCGTNDLSNMLNNKIKLNKTITPTDLVKVSKYMRYIDVGSSGNSVNSGNHIVELEVYDVNGVNRAAGIIPAIIKGEYYPEDVSTMEAATDGIKNTTATPYLNIAGVNTLARFDLGDVYEISHVKLWRYYPDKRTYYKTFCYGRAGDRPEDGLSDGELVYKFHDYKRDGTYKETSAGQTWYVDKEPVDISQPVINSFTANTTSWTNQGVVLTILAEDDFGSDDLIYSFDGGKNWTKNNTITVFINKTYTAVVKDKKGNISTTNPTINVSTVDLIPPSQPFIITRYDNANGEEYTGEWTNQDVYFDIKEGNSPNLCQSIIERGYIDKDTGDDISDKTKIREVNKMFITGTGTLYIQKYNRRSVDIDTGIITLYFYDGNDNYLGYKDVDLTNPFIEMIEGSGYCKLADTSDNLDNYYLVAESSEAIPYIDYYEVYDNLSGIQGYYYKISENSNTYLPIPKNDVIDSNFNSTIYIVTRDNAGNNSRYITKTIKIDKDAPRDATLVCKKEGNNLHVIAHAVDDFSGIKAYRFTIDGYNTYTDWQESNEYVFTNLNGIYEVGFEVTDFADNIGGPDNWQVVAIGDISQYPVITELKLNRTDWTNGLVAVTITGAPGSGAPEGTTITKYSFNNGYSWGKARNKTFSDNGIIYCRVQDSNGNMSETYTITINNIDKIPPTLNVPESSLQVPVGTQVDVWSGVTYYDNDSGIDESKTIASIVDTSILTLGEHEVEYSVTDNAGNTSTKLRTIMILGSVPADTLYPRDDLYPENLSLPNSELASYTHEQLSQYKLSELRGGSIQ